MGFRGLFIGIDRYESSGVRWLDCARRDAEALHALFSDTLGEGAKLLTDSGATRTAIEEELIKLAHCDPDDVVVIGFSGHGTDYHQLVTYDTDPTSSETLNSSTIPLESLTEKFRNIPAKRLICFLDCCFSGGMAAKVLKSDTLPRSHESAEQALAQMSGEGRIILTASTATEEAFENQKLNHGLLTYYLLEALQGVEEVCQAGKIPVYGLLQYVTQRVIDGAAQLRVSQNPTLRGTIDGELTWPIFVPGSMYKLLYPETQRAEVSSDLGTLKSFGFPQELIQAWGNTIPGLNTLQIEAINDYGILNGEHLIVSAPTSSGKTLIGELAALKGAINRKKTLFLLPLKALVNDKLRQFNTMYGDYGIRTIHATGETDDIKPLLLGQYDICLLTYEKFAAIILANPYVLNQVGTLVIDEVQMIADPSRGANLEFTLTLLQTYRRQGIEPQVIALSAVIGDANGFDRWLHARLLRRVERPVPLDEGLLLADGCFRHIDGHDATEKLSSPIIQRRYGKGSSQDWLIPLIQKLTSDGQQVIVFRETKSEARSVARYLSRELNLAPAHGVIDFLPSDDVSIAAQLLQEVLLGGVAFHVSDLNPDERRIIEDQFREKDSAIRVIVATTTLAMGVNTPTDAVVVVGLTHPGNQPYSVAEYKNMVGRAGRLGLSDKGSSYLFALSSHDEQHYWNRYVMGHPEDIRSQLFATSTDIRSLIIRSIVALQKRTPAGIHKEEVIAFLEASFAVFQAKYQQENWTWDRNEFAAHIGDLTHHGIIEELSNGNILLTELGWVAGESVMEMESIIRLIKCLSPLAPESISDPCLLVTAQVTVELDDVYFPMNKRSTRKEPAAWQHELRGQSVSSSVLSNLQLWVQERHQSTSRAKKAVACLLYITQKQMLDMEQDLTRYGGLGGAAGAILATTSRTCDVLPTVARIAEILHPDLDLDERVTKLLIRLANGIPAQAVDLARYAGGELSRGDYLRLLTEGLCEIEALDTASDEVLLQQLGGNIDKFTAVRDAVFRYRQAERKIQTDTPVLEPYQA